MHKILAFILCVLVFGGCSSYELASTEKKVEVENISPKTFKVNFCGNAYMTQKEVEKYALQRAAEDAISKGYSSFRVLAKNDDSKMCTLKDAATQGPAKRSSSYDFQPFVKPNITLTVQCYSKDENKPDDALDAQKFLDENFPGLGK